MDTVKRTQIYIDEELDQQLRTKALAEGRSAAALVREALRSYLAKGKAKAQKDPFLELSGAFSGGPRDSSLEHDRYLYGTGSGC